MKLKPKPNPVEPSEDEQQPDPFSTTQGEPESEAIAPPVAAAQPEAIAPKEAFPTTADSDPLFANTRAENGCLIYEGVELLDSKTQRCIYRFGEVLRKDKLQVEIMAIYELYVPPGYVEERFIAALNK